MDSKRTTGCLVIPRKRSGLVLRDTTGNRDQNAQFCNRLGCNGRLNHYTKGTEVGCSGKPESLKSAFRSSNGKEVLGSSTTTCSVATDRRKLFQSQKKLCGPSETDSSENNSAQDVQEGSESIPSQGKIHTGIQSESGEDGLVELGGNTRVASISRPRRVFRQKSELGNQGTLLGKSDPQASKTTCQGVRNSANANRYGLRTLKCNSVSDVMQSGCSSSKSPVTQRKEMVKKRNPERESSSSSSSERKMNEPSTKVGRSSVSASGSSISDSRQPPPKRDNGVASVRTHRSINGNTRTRLSNRGNGNSTSLTESPLLTPHVAQPDIPIGVSGSSSSHQFSAEASSSRSNSSSRPSSGSGHIPSMVPSGLGERGNTRSSMNLDGLRRYNMDGIAEVLLALERIEQDEELTYEQLLALEANLFMGGLSFYDQHRDMRLDIDNMSYEELLALEEKMGNVSTAVSEEALSKCLRKSIYQAIPLSSVEGTTGFGGNKDDTKCSICQEEYVVGDEVGRLVCEHSFHGVCINQWLLLKNWCPICKASVTVAPPPPPPSQSSLSDSDMLV